MVVMKLSHESSVSRALCTLPLAKNLWQPPAGGVSSFAHLDAGHVTWT